MKNKKSETYYDRFIKDPKRKKMVDDEYKKLVISETILELMEINKLTVRGLAKKAEVSTSIIQELRAGTKTNITLRNFFKILVALNADVLVKKGKKEFPLLKDVG